MAEDLWKLRKRRGLSVKQLAAKSGVSAVSIESYEAGEPVRVSDLARLAKALFVDELDIRIRSEPRPAPVREAAVPQAREAAPQPKAAPPQKQAQPPARPTQISHLLALAANLGEDAAQVQAAAGKPLEQLTRAEAGQLLRDYTDRIKAEKQAADAVRPPGTRRRRAHLPEGVDEFELAYLTACQEEGATLSFKLLNGECHRGQVLGFSPYFIAVRCSDGSEVAIHKLALAYYVKEVEMEAGS